jgi:hypothetical protein
VLVILGALFALVHPWKTRRQIWVLLFEIFTGFCRPVRFIHIFYADWTTSFVKVFIAMAQASCYYISGAGFNECPQPEDVQQCNESVFFLNLVLPVLSTLPYLLRLLHCLRCYLDTHLRFPHIANGFKYGIALVIVAIGVTHGAWKQPGVPHPTRELIVGNIWICLYAISTAYTYSWDVFMDWGLSFKDGRPYVLAFAPLRRQRRMVNKDSYWPYYTAVVADLGLRFLWTLTLAPGFLPFGSFVNEYVKPLLMYAEIIRRAMWSIFRVEQEHLNQTASYKQIEYVPLHFERPAPPKRPPTLLSVLLEVGAFVFVVGATYVVAFATHQPDPGSNMTLALPLA